MKAISLVYQWAKLYGMNQVSTWHKLSQTFATDTAAGINCPKWLVPQPDFTTRGAGYKYLMKQPSVWNLIYDIWSGRSILRLTIEVKMASLSFSSKRSIGKTSQKEKYNLISTQISVILSSKLF